MAVPTYTKAGAKAATPAKLDKAVFGVLPKDHTLLKEAYVAYMANGRDNLAVTKTRGLVSGGGRKPWRQKGTGNARFGSSRNPIWRGGGIAFGPTGQENFTKRLSASSKRQAIRQALSLAAEADKVIVIEDVIAKGKTAEIAKLLSKLNAKRNVLLVVDQKTPELIRASRNLANLKVVDARYVNTFDCLNANHIVFSQAALKTTSQWLAKEAK